MAFSDSQRDVRPAPFVVAGLELLIALPLVTADDVDRWDMESARFQDAVEAQFPGFEYEHHVWHFLTDSDIRRTDAGYREQQHRAIVRYIERLRSAD